MPPTSSARPAANRAHAAAVRSGALRRESPQEPATAPGSCVPAIVGNLNFDSQQSINRAPSDATGAIGPTRYIQLVNSNVRIYKRNKAVVATGTLNELADNAAQVNSFDPQIIWDAQTKRF